MRLLQPTGARGLAAITSAVVLLVVALPALAEPPTASERAKAKQHFEAGKAAFEAKDYAAATLEYTQAYEIMPLPGLLFNIAQCFRNLQKHAEAVVLFKRYVREAPEAGNRAAVERLIAELEAKLGESQDGAAAAAEPPPPPPPPPPLPASQPTEQAETQPAHPLVTAPPVSGPTEAEVTAAGRPITDDARDKPAAAPIYTRWWLWTAIGVVVAGGVTAALLATLESDADVAPSRFPTWHLPEIR